MFRVCLVALAIVLASTDAFVTTAPPPTEEAVTEEPKTIFDVKIGERQVTNIELSWDQPEEGEVTAFRVRARKADSEDRIISPDLSPADSEYLLENLMPNSEYKICIVGEMKGKPEVEDCRTVNTIPVIRDDSLIVLFACLGYILLTIVVGVLCWTCAKKRARAAAEEEEEEEEEEDVEPEKIQPAIYRPAYVSPPTDSAVRSSIEDNPDIPYITPPVDQLNKTNARV